MATLLVVLKDYGKSTSYSQIYSLMSPGCGSINPLSCQVRDVMKSSLVSIIKESVEAYKNTPRKDWVIDWPGQIVLAGSQIYWTTEVEEVKVMRFPCF